MATLVETPRRPATEAHDGAQLLALGLHRLRNLVMSVRGYAELIGRGEGEPEQWRRWAEKIVSQLDRLEHLHSRLDAARGGDAVQDLPLGMLLRAADERSRARVGRAAAAVEVEVAVMPGTRIAGEREALTEALAGLFDNARESHAAAGSAARVQVREQIDADGTWVLTVRDFGIGMDPTDAECVGRPFFTRKAGHVGLGVYLGRTLLSRHDLDLTLGAAEGTGTVANIRHRRRPNGGDR